MAKKVLTDHFSTPLSRVTTAKVDINMVDGNLMIDGLISGEPVLASGKLQYLENQGLPTQVVNTSNDHATLTLRTSGKGQPWFRLPWAACNGATEWQIHLNPTVSSDITAHTGGGNVSLNLAGMAVTRVLAVTGGGNIEVILPDNAAGLHVDARTGAGNMVIHIPGGIAARIQATSGFGKVIVDPRFSKIDGTTYQSPDYDSAVDKVEITVQSGAGNVSVDERTVQYEAATIQM